MTIFSQKNCQLNYDDIIILLFYDWRQFASIVGCARASVYDCVNKVFPVLNYYDANSGISITVFFEFKNKLLYYLTDSVTI